MSTAGADSSTLAVLADSSARATTTADSATQPTATENSASRPTATADSSCRLESVALPLSVAVVKNSESESIKTASLLEQISTESSLLNISTPLPVWPLNTNSEELDIHHPPRAADMSSSSRLSPPLLPPPSYNYGKIPEMPSNNYGTSLVMPPREGQTFRPHGSHSKNRGSNHWRRPHQPVRPFIRHPQPFAPYQFGRPFVSPSPFAPHQSGTPFVSSPLPFVPQQFARPFISPPLLPLVPDQSPFVSPPPPPPYVFDSPTAFSNTTPYIPFESYKPVPVPTLVRKQIEYYFSGVNLQTDEHLKSKMDNRGWVPITLIAGFPRVKSLTSDIGLILESLKFSTVVEVQDDKVRKRNDWMKWIPTSGQNEKEGTPPTQH